MKVVFYGLLRAKTCSKWFYITFFLLLTSLSACSYRVGDSISGEALVLQPISTSNISIRTSEFSNLFCRIYERRNSQIGDCEDLFLAKSWHKFQLEPTPERMENSLFNRIHLVVIPGIFGECIKDEISPFQKAYSELKLNLPNLSFSVANSVRGRADSAYNAQAINDYLDNLELPGDAKLVVLSYSKGTTDFLYYLSTHYDNSSKQISAMISLSGVVNGSILADASEGLAGHLVHRLQSEHCEDYEGDEVSSITLRQQINWLHRNRHIFESDIKMYSIVTVSDEESTSVVFKMPNRFIKNHLGMNDGQVSSMNQILPNSDLLAYMVADHWAIILPFSDQRYENLSPHNRILKYLATRNDFPRAALLESIVRFIDLDIENSAAKAN